MEQGMLNNQQREQMQGIAALGRNEDTYLAHVAPDEMIVPAQALRDNPLLKVAIEKSISNYGIDPNQFLVGNGSMDLNPLTGLPEFGFLSKLWKKAKKIVKVVAPIAINFIPGIGPIAGAALTAAAGKASGLSTKQALLGGALSFAGGKLFGGNPAAGAAGKATSTGGNIFSRAGEFLTKGKDGVGLFGNLGKGLGSMKEYAFKGKDGVGLFGNLGKTFMGGASELTVQPGESLSSIAAREGTTVAELLKANPSITNPNLIQAGAKLAMPGGGAGILSTLGTGARNLITGGGQPGQSQLGMIEDMLKGRPSDFSTPGSGRIGLDRNRFGGGQGGPGQGGGGMFDGIGNMLGGNMGALGLAGLMGKFTYDAAKERSGGLAETPQVAMDQLGRYQMAQNLGTGGSRADFGLAPAPLALDFNMGGPVYGYNYGGPVRQYFNKGGLAIIQELDMRDGGESDGPGTGTSDDIPAMLSDGEFVMTAKATKGAGAFDVNKTKSGIELIKGGSPSRKKGVENMRELMNIFEAI
jgi:LysM repeat protein